MNVAPSSPTREEVVDRIRVALADPEFQEKLKETIVQSEAAITRLEQLRQVSHDSLARPMTR